MTLILVLTAFVYLSLQPLAVIAEDGHNHSEHGSEEKRSQHGSAALKVNEFIKKDKDPHEDHIDGFIRMSSVIAKKSKLTISKAYRENFIEIVNLPGEVAVNGNTIVHVAPRFSGTLKIVARQIGEKVKPGDLLVKIQSNESLSIYDIYSEIDGIIIDKDSSVGEFVTNKKVIFTIANFDTIWVNAAVYSNHLSSIKEGQAVRVISKSNNLSQIGTIDYLRPTLSEETRTALARIVLKNPDSKWFPGMFVNVEIKLSSNRKSLIIPSESAVFIQNQYFVFIPDKDLNGDEGFKKQRILIGKSNENKIEVIDGLKENDEIASGNTYILKAELGKGSTEHSH